MTSKLVDRNTKNSDVYEALKANKVQDTADILPPNHDSNPAADAGGDHYSADFEVSAIFYSEYAEISPIFYSEYLEEFEYDLSEELESLSEELEDISSSKLVLKSSLMDKLSLYPDGAFPISDYSTFKDDQWVFYDKAQVIDAKGFNFKDSDSDLMLFKKVIMYHYIPTFHPFGTIKSFATTFSYINGLTNIERFIFKANHMSDLLKGIPNITARMLNDSLDEAKSAEHSSSYKSLYSALAFWSVLSENGLIPEAFRLNVKMSKVLTKERRQDVVRHALRNTIPYTPFLQSELEGLINYALFWTDSAIPVIEKAIIFCRDNGIHSGARKVHSPGNKNEELEQIFSTRVEGKEIIGYSATIKTDQKDKKKSNNYYTFDKLAVAIDNVRNAIFIFVALITGMRRRELAQLAFDDFHRLKNGECYVDVTRFKVSDDPNYSGEAATLPIPEYLYELIFQYHSMREYMGKLENEHLFISCKSRVKKKNQDSSILHIIVREISDATKIDGLHTHRFRKSIAEILIGQDETNIDLIRELLGHKSFVMTLRYIARNPYLVRAVARIMEHHHAHEFEQIINAINSGHFSGHAFERIAAQIKKRPAEFKGARLKLTIREYVLALLEAGEPVFLHRTPMGTYCLSIPMLGGDDYTPCVQNAVNVTGRVIPEPSNCQYDKCHKAGITLKAKQAIEENIIFFSGLIEQKDVALPTHSLRELKRRLKRERQHLQNLEKYRSPLVESGIDNESNIRGTAS
ncbi:tyrosine-type recombinase/integrase [Rheinheimera soli]|uniref:tyrosine-type recombinase/integrase n=1 Tax=Rheinheimera soli TaxID=443616 RepID=UPI001E304ACE|nr:tyrosine-type recombinase/integrase [Rheinheimera soli]